MELYTLVLGLDVLGNPVNVVKGVVGGTIDLFYEPIKVCSLHNIVCESSQDYSIGQYYK